MTSRAAPTPFSTEDEAALLGAALLTHDAALLVADHTGPGDYWDPLHRKVSEAIGDLIHAGVAVDVQTVASEVARHNGQDVATIKRRVGELMAGTPAASNAPAYLRAVHEWTRLRRARALAAELREATLKDVDHLAERIPELRDAAKPTPSFLHDRRAAADIAETEDRVRWLVRGILTDQTFGVLAGAKKALKTHIALAVKVAVASGQPLFGQFPVPEPRPVLAYVGEGGRHPYERRLRRMAHAYGVDWRHLPLEYRSGTLPALSPEFQGVLARDLAELRPGLVSVDPLYAYHGVETKSSLLNERGALLTSLSGPCIDAGAVLLLNDHFNQTGSGFDLDRVTGAGVGEWADTWILAKHREHPDVDQGQFRLTLEVGSRQWGATTWDLDLDIGPFDIDAGQHIGDITWNIHRHNPAETDTTGTLPKLKGEILDVLTDEPWRHTRTDTKRLVGGKAECFGQAFDELKTAELIVSERLPHEEHKRLVTRDLWAPAGTVRPKGINPFPEMGTNRNRLDP